MQIFRVEISFSTSSIFRMNRFKFSRKKHFSVWHKCSIWHNEKKQLWTFSDERQQEETFGKPEKSSPARDSDKIYSIFPHRQWVHIFAWILEFKHQNKKNKSFPNDFPWVLSRSPLSSLSVSPSISFKPEEMVGEEAKSERKRSIILSILWKGKLSRRFFSSPLSPGNHNSIFHVFFL